MKLSKTETAIGIGILYLIYLTLAGVWMFSFDDGQLTQQLKWVSPLILDLNFFLWIVGLILCGKIFGKIFRQNGMWTWVLLGALVFCGISLAMFAAPREHRIYYDEDIYMNAGQNIACLHQTGMCNDGDFHYGQYACNRLEYNKDPNGWPYLMSLVMRVFGFSHISCFILNNIVFGFSIVVVFFIGRHLFGDPRIGLFSALIFALIPEAIRWSNTTAAEPSSALFVGMALLFVVWFLRTPSNDLLFLSAVTLPLAFQFRPESVLAVIPVMVSVLALNPKVVNEKRTWLALLLVLVLSLPHLVHLAAVRGASWGAPSGLKFSMSFFVPNLRTNSFFYIENKGFPILSTILFVCGLGVPLAKNVYEKSKDHGLSRLMLREKAVLISWFLVFWGIFLFFYAGSYRYGADVRFSLLSFMPVSLFAGFGCFAISRWVGRKLPYAHAVMAGAIIFAFISFLPDLRAVGQEAWGARADHHFAEKMAESLPPDSIVLTHNPSMFLLWGVSAAQASFALNEPGFVEHIFKRYTGGVYFHYNFWCNVDDPSQKTFCGNMLAAYDYEEFMSFKEQHYRYVLYKLKRK
jgi:hypothetical protein